MSVLNWKFFTSASRNESGIVVISSKEATKSLYIACVICVYRNGFSQRLAKKSFTAPSS
jgi:hypothetical protein